MAEETEVVTGSPPVVQATEAETELDRARRRLVELQVALTERFDRKGWDEYVRLRRAVLPRPIASGSD
jgi:hypothetical protein